jgi:hypothetical protein
VIQDSKWGGGKEVKSTSHGSLGGVEMGQKWNQCSGWVGLEGCGVTPWGKEKFRGGNWLE